MNLPKPNCRSTDASSALREYTQGALLDCVRSGFAQCGAELQALYLFGSRARGGAGCRPGSDFDLAYFANPELSALTQFKLANDLAEALGVEHVVADAPLTDGEQHGIPKGRDVASSACLRKAELRGEGEGRGTR